MLFVEPYSDIRSDQVDVIAAPSRRTMSSGSAPPGFNEGDHAALVGGHEMSASLWLTRIKQVGQVRDRERQIEASSFARSSLRPRSTSERYLQAAFAAVDNRGVLCLPRFQRPAVSLPVRSREHAHLLPACRAGSVPTLCVNPV